MRAIIADVCGVQTAFSTGGGSSDGRFLRDICGELAEFGVLNAGIHEINERVADEDVRRLDGGLLSFGGCFTVQIMSRWYNNFKDRRS